MAYVAKRLALPFELLVLKGLVDLGQPSAYLALNSLGSFWARKCVGFGWLAPTGDTWTLTEAGVQAYWTSRVTHLPRGACDAYAWDWGQVLGRS